MQAAGWGWMGLQGHGPAPSPRLGSGLSGCHCLVSEKLRGSRRVFPPSPRYCLPWPASLQEKADEGGGCSSLWAGPMLGGAFCTPAFLCGHEA